MSLWGTKGCAVTGEKSQKITTRIDPLRPQPPGVIPSPREADPSESISVARPASLNAVVAGIAAVAVVVGAALLSHHVLATTLPAPAVTPQRSSADVGYLKTVRQQPDFVPTSDDSLIKTGHLLCDQLHRGVNPDQIALVSTGKPYTVDDVSTAVGASVGAYCPDQMARIGPHG